MKLLNKGSSLVLIESNAVNNKKNILFFIIYVGKL